MKCLIGTYCKKRMNDDNDDPTRRFIDDDSHIKSSFLTLTFSLDLNNLCTTVLKHSVESRYTEHSGPRDDLLTMQIRVNFKD